jgi:hypothetical protein
VPGQLGAPLAPPHQSVAASASSAAFLDADTNLLECWRRKVDRWQRGLVTARRICRAFAEALLLPVTPGGSRCLNGFSLKHPRYSNGGG